MRFLAIPLLITALFGCTASVKKTGEDQISTYADAKEAVVVNLHGNAWVQGNADWPKLRAVWLNALQRESSSAGLKYTEQNGDTRPVPFPSMLVSIDVSNFRYVTSGERYGLGVMVGNAWVNSTVTYLDGQTGELMGSRKFDTSSSAWEGVFSAMSDDQVAAISKAIMTELASAKAMARPASSGAGSPPASDSKEQQLNDLQGRNLPYDEYQREYRKIMDGRQ